MGRPAFSGDVTDLRIGGVGRILEGNNLQSVEDGRNLVGEAFDPFFSTPSRSSAATMNAGRDIRLANAPDARRNRSSRISNQSRRSA